LADTSCFAASAGEAAGPAIALRFFLCSVQEKSQFDE
jgi:hypothetical protein